MTTAQARHGWTAVPRSFEKLLASKREKHPSRPLGTEDIPLPQSALVDRVLQYAKDKLPVEVLNHSMQVFYYGQAIALQHFPEWQYSPETYLLACLLHDIGTTPANQASTLMSFEFQGGYIALDLLKSLNAELAQAEAVAEAIIRHQDLGDTGNVTIITAIILLSTAIDNAGLNGELVHQSTIESVVAKYPRNQWTSCFAAVVRTECGLKPWANISRIVNSAEVVEANTLMSPYD